MEESRKPRLSYWENRMLLLVDRVPHQRSNPGLQDQQQHQLPNGHRVIITFKLLKLKLTSLTNFNKIMDSRHLEIRMKIKTQINQQISLQWTNKVWPTTTFRITNTLHLVDRWHNHLLKTIMYLTNLKYPHSNLWTISNSNPIKYRLSIKLKLFNNHHRVPKIFK